MLENKFGVGWCFVVSPWKEGIDGQYLKKDSTDDTLYVPKENSYDKMFSAKYNPHY